MRPRLLDALLVGVLVLGGTWIALTRDLPGQPAPSPAPAAASEPAPVAGHPAPEFTLPALDGTPVTLAALRGQVVLINVWASWCPPCRAEMPAIQAAYNQYGPQGFVVLAVNMQEPAGVAQAYLEEQGLTFPTLLDSEGQVSQLYLARVLPSSYVVDRRGIVRAVYFGPMPPAVIATMIEQLVAEQP